MSIESDIMNNILKLSKDERILLGVKDKDITNIVGNKNISNWNNFINIFIPPLQQYKRI